MVRKYAVLMATASMAALLLLLAACDDEPTQEQAQEQFCDDVGVFLAALGDLRDVDRDTPIEEFEDARENVRVAYDNMIASAQELREARVDELSQANANLQGAVEDIDDEESLEEALASIEDEADAVAEEVSQLLNDVDCGSGQGAQENSDE